MNKLLKDAIADAKAVRETALANAKVALEEAFAPKLQSMLSHKIKEEMEETEKGIEKSEDEEQMEAMQKMAGIRNEYGLEHDPEQIGDQNKDGKIDVDDASLVKEDDEEEYSDESEDEMEMDVDSEEEYSDESEMDMDMGSEEGEEVSDEELEEILRELDSEEGMESEEAPEDEMEMEMNYEGEMSDEDEEINLEEIIAALREEDEVEASEEEAPEASEELEEAYGVIKYLRTKINEVNLLNAKLLYVNKLFRKGELTETQKVKIIETFDRAKNVREAKLIYATLAESVSAKKTKTTVAPKRKMNEGFASAPSKKTQIISESNGVYNRFKTLVEYNNKK